MEFTKEQEILSQVINEAWSNPSFKQELMASPQEAVKKLTGETFSLPAGKTLEVCDNSKPGVVYLNIPESPNMENLELTDAQLEVVAGGTVPKSITINSYMSSKNTFPPVITTSNGDYNPFGE
jgi:hypothetical protein